MLSWLVAMSEIGILVLGLALSTFAIRYAGYALGAAIPQSGYGARVMGALPGCLIVSLLALLISQGDRTVWLASLLIALFATRVQNLALVMLTGMGLIALLRHLVPQVL